MCEIQIDPHAVRRLSDNRRPKKYELTSELLCRYLQIIERGAGIGLCRKAYYTGVFERVICNLNHNLTPDCAPKFLLRIRRTGMQYAPTEIHC